MSSIQDSPLSHQTVTASFNATDGDSVPFLLPICLGQDTTSPLTLLIPGVAGPDAAQGQCGPSGDNDDFSLAWVKSRGPSAGLLAQITVQPTRVFSTKPADREALRSSFRSFCEALDALEQQTSPQCLLSGGAAVITNRVASSLPLALDEVLFYYYGFDPALRCLDLHPGMRLAVETASYQFINPASKRESQANAFTPGGVTYLSVDRGPDQTLSFSPFLSDLAPYQVSSPGALAGLLDLCSAYTPAGGGSAQTYQRRYFRLIYPSQFPSPTDIGSQPKISQSVTLLGANTLAELNQATESFVQTRTCGATAANSVVCLYFDGRVAISPEMPVIVQGEIQYVPVGSSLQDMLDTLLLAPPQSVVDQINQGITLWRYSFNALCPQTVPQSYGQNSLNFTQAQAGAGTGLELALPLIKGDAIRLDLSPQNPTPYYQVQTTPLAASGTDPAGPYLFPVGFSCSQPLQVPNVTGPKTGSGCEISSETGFSLSWSGQAAQVTVPAAACSDDPADRAGLLAAFNLFRQALDELERSTDCLVPGGARYIAGLVAGSLPLRLDEILAYRYGLDPVSRRYLDLQPGMRLLLETGAYQFVAPSPQTGSTLNAYTARGQVAYQVVRDANQQLTFSPFLRGVSPYQVNKGGLLSGGLLDLAQADSGRRHYRLIYPSTFLPSAPDWSSSSPLPGMANNVVLLGADSLADLNAATPAVLKGETPTQTGLVLRYFAGRSSLIPQIQVSVQGQLQWVPVGTTLQQVIERLAVLAGDEIYDFVTSGPDQVLRRATVPVVQNTVLQGLGTYPVQFDQNTQVVAGPGGQALTQWSVPLVGGDLVQWPWNT